MRQSEKKGTGESLISRCKPSTREQAQENEVLERVKVGMRKDINVVKGGKDTHQGGKNAVQKGIGKRWKNRAHCERAATASCTPLMKMTMKI